MLKTKSDILVYAGLITPRPAGGATYIEDRWVFPSMQGYESGVLYIRTANKAPDGQITFFLDELLGADDVQGAAITNRIVSSSSTSDLWRQSVILPAIHYRIRTSHFATAADVEIRLIVA